MKSRLIRSSVYAISMGFAFVFLWYGILATVVLFIIHKNFENFGYRRTVLIPIGHLIALLCGLPFYFGLL